MRPFAARRARVAAALREAEWRRRHRADRAGAASAAATPTIPIGFGSDFHYLTGFDEPGAWLLITADGNTTLLCRPKDAEREIWDGLRLGPDAAPAALGVDDAFALDRLDAVMVELLADQP